MFLYICNCWRCRCELLSWNQTTCWFVCIESRFDQAIALWNMKWFSYVPLNVMWPKFPYWSRHVAPPHSKIPLLVQENLWLWKRARETAIVLKALAHSCIPTKAFRQIDDRCLDICNKRQLDNFLINFIVTLVTYLKGAQFSYVELAWFLVIITINADQILAWIYLCAISISHTWNIVNSLQSLCYLASYWWTIL